MPSFLFRTILYSYNAKEDDTMENKWYAYVVGDYGNSVGLWKIPKHQYENYKHTGKASIKLLIARKGDRLVRTSNYVRETDAEVVKAFDEAF
jgi:hypothetical protein